MNASSAKYLRKNYAKRKLKSLNFYLFLRKIAVRWCWFMVTFSKKEALKHWNLQGGVYLNNGQLGGMRDAKKT
ncbi:hypothetical protein I6J17_06505 [Heyndrickxia coagulans]|uniref:Uncharacterized protein n=1 Tax=Heyndrickxia coagulans DSM 1 = ATCC 7050 TaxID=1121088 RepID=A0A8B4BVL0_HEYCO|nr:hypothetical protein [Heyndrickxia coagulans]AJH78278.1 hypothetical protein BF29_2931 [Heyndrickxia coagulans DSM 1 = ATCC 7050]MCR2847096.1 hypothetical protein [Heyndrickxia coagulans]MDR4224591.1 hypothetical protein [Heyndrickxia coagulans DSM 1 = ATCC 7050]QJE31600.1 hypothetical protein HHU11_02340 [Heyndrickxia coagulans]QQS93565.1 hypothetical protein I6J17_06505 [Heyndrickxia coagulans]